MDSQHDGKKMVYLLHIKPPYKHARHYLGSTPDTRLAQRLSEHRSGKGARLTQVVTEAGHELILARTWEGGREKERELKRWKNSPRLCPICNPNLKMRSDRSTTVL